MNKMEDKNIIIAVIIIIAIILFSGAGMMGFGSYGNMFNMMNYSFLGFGIILGWIINLLLIIIFVLVIIWLIKQIQNTRK